MILVEANLTVMQTKMIKLIISRSLDRKWKFSIKIYIMTKYLRVKMVKMQISVKAKRVQVDCKTKRK